MNIILKPKKYIKITNDDEFYETWQRVNYLDGYADAKTNHANDELDFIKNPDRERNKLIDLMKKYNQEQERDQEVVCNKD